MLICECPHRDHGHSDSVPPRMVANVGHPHLAGISVAVAFEVRMINAKTSAQAAICGPCVDALH